MDDADTPLRADAQRNRQRIIAAAAAVLAEKGLGAGFNEIAHRAGVGVGTIYRHFPRREALIEAVMHGRIAEMDGFLEQALAAPSAWAAFELVFRGAVAMNIANLGVRDAIFGVEGADGRLASHQEVLAGPLAQLLDRARAEGMLRPEITVADVVMLILMLVEFGHRSQPVAPDAVRRYVDLILGSLRARPDAPPLGAELPDADARRIGAAWIAFKP
ncbi:helix-turn-helix domain containing protein [Sphingomonas sp. HITSZ_GF]|uniref:TetR/AcrR family transcriptional regulator n=1 Tax=Sphingomonas sp. HITSZ_GF TaxID=3037247 RepID=UPI00240CF1E2|nr:TetR/AcrR family transcriptional regulator [Sphingomonas sp. HITSZ_GF]MDG2535179.1 helix-turn-helix domain containing protein [Sphingomonas sp. HITSZ_GF]